MDFLSRLFGRRGSKDGLQQAHREAILDLLLFALYADNQLSLAEEEVLHKQSENMVWEAVTPLDSYLDQATSKARAAQSSEATRSAYLKRVCGRLDSPVARERALSLLTELFEADGASEPELAFRERFAAMLQDPA